MLFPINLIEPGIGSDQYGTLRYGYRSQSSAVYAVFASTLYSLPAAITTDLPSSPGPNRFPPDEILAEHATSSGNRDPLR